MQRGPAIFIVLLILAIAGFLAFDAIRSRRAPMPTPDQSLASSTLAGIAGTPGSTVVIPRGTTPQSPISGEQLPERVTAEWIMTEFAQAGSAVERDTEAQLYQGMYNSDRGWEAQIVELRDLSDIAASGMYQLRMRASSPAVPGGWFQIESLLSTKPANLQQGDWLTYVAKIDRLEVRSPTGIAPGQPLLADATFHMVLKDLRVVQVVRR